MPTKAKKPYKLVYHVFTDNNDEYTATRKEAEQIWRDWKKEGFRNLRIYKTWWDTEWDFETGQEPEEHWIKGIGDFPE